MDVGRGASDHSIVWRRGDDAAVAIQTPEEAVTYAELKRRVDQLATSAREYFAGREEPVVGVLLPGGAAFTAAFLAALESGATVVPLEPALPDDRLLQLIHAARPALIITDEKQRERLGAEAGGGAVRTLAQ